MEQCLEGFNDVTCLNEKLLRILSAVSFQFVFWEFVPPDPHCLAPLALEKAENALSLD